MGIGLVAVIALASIALAKRTEAEMRTVPDASPMYVQDAETRRAGFKASISSVPPITRADRNVNGYVVEDQSPQAGSRAPVGSTVRLTVGMSINGGTGGLGAEGRITVPQLVGLDINHAVSVATTHGLFVNVAPLDPGVWVQRLVVTRQSEPPGSMVDAGTEITLSLS